MEKQRTSAESANLVTFNETKCTLVAIHSDQWTLGFPATHIPVEGHGWQLEAEDVAGLVSQLPP